MKIRFATIEDIPTILDLIRSIAEYEKLLDQVAATEDILKNLFEYKSAEVLIGEVDHKPIGFALFSITSLLLQVKEDYI